MKKLLPVALVFSLTLPSSAQYRCIPDMQSYGNPGGVPLGDFDLYNTLGIYYSPVPVWSSVVHLDFPFNFNGQPVTDFKVSSTGVLTFDTLAVAVPPLSNALLPDAQIPDKSICIRGISALYQNGTSAYSILKTEYITNYSTLPSCRQLWICFQNYTDTITNNFNRTVIWSIVLEENTNNIYIVDQFDGTSIQPQLTLGIQADGVTAYMAPGSPDITSHSGVTGGASDNSYYAFIPGNALTNDGTVTASLLQNYLRITDAPFTVGAKFRNFGTDTLHSIQLNYSVNGGTAISESFGSLNIPCGGIQWLYFTSPFNPADTGVYQLDIWADNLNGAIDQDSSNDHFLQRIYVAQVLPPRRAMFEEFKGTWCLWSGYWTHKYDSILALNTNKASSIKYEDTNNLIWNSQDDYIREAFYHLYAIPNSYANGTLMQNDHTLFPGCPWNVTQPLIDSLYDLPGLFYVQPHLDLNGFTATISGTVTTAVNFPDGTNCRIYVSLVEDTITFATSQGASGETLFVNTSRKLFPDGYGTFIGTPELGQVDSVNFSQLITDTLVNLSKLRVVIFVQDTVTKEIYQCAEAPAIQNCIPVYHATVYHICDGDSVNILGTWISQTGNYPTIYTGANGCDSMQLDIVKVHVLSCSIFNNSGQLQVSSYSYFTGDTITFNWYDNTNQQLISGATGQNYTPTQPGMYSLIISNQMGCTAMSNIINFNCSPDSTQQNFTFCSGDSIQIGNNWYSVAGTYVDSLITFLGCDSIVTTVLTEFVIDTSLTANGDTLFANPAYANYEWIDCGTGLPVSGAAGNVFIATYSGSFSVVITDTNGCSLESGCVPVTVTGIFNQVHSSEIMLLPNPASDYTQLIFDAELKNGYAELVDLNGKKLQSFFVNNRVSSISLNEISPGVYYLKIYESNIQVAVKLLAVIR